MKKLFLIFFYVVAIFIFSVIVFCSMLVYEIISFIYKKSKQILDYLDNESSKIYPY